MGWPTPAAQAAPSEKTPRIPSCLHIVPQPTALNPSLDIPSGSPAASPPSLHSPAPRRAFSGCSGLTRKCSRLGAASSARKEYFRGSRSCSSATVAAVRVAAGWVRAFRGGGWSGAGSRSHVSAARFAREGDEAVWG